LRKETNLVISIGLRIFETQKFKHSAKIKKIFEFQIFFLGNRIKFLGLIMLCVGVRIAEKGQHVGR